MATASGITHLAIAPVYVADQQRALEFYRDVLGFEVHTDSSFGDQRWIEIAPAASPCRLSLMLTTGVPFDAHVGVGPGYAFSTDDAASTRAALVDLGATHVGELTSEPWGTYFTFQDPDGNAFVVSQSSDG